MPDSPPTSHYACLEVPPDATAQQLRQAFRSLSKRYHPDTTSLPAAEAQEAFRRLRQAYAVLGDPQARAEYDRRLRQPQGPPIVISRSVSVAQGQPRSDGVRRALSGGEWFALLLLGLAMLLSLLLGLGLAWARGTELVKQPSWWSEPPAGPAAASTAAPAVLGAPSPAASPPSPSL
ncbi:MAG: J domain-containing protein [Cyanobium sp.]